MKPLSICITSCNRLKYVKALLQSLREFDSEPNVQISVVDMGSTEPGLISYLSAQERSGFIDFYHFSPQSHKRDWINDEYIARNKLIEMSKHETSMFLQDDGQFIANKEALAQVLDDFYSINDGYCLEIYGVRTQSMRDTLDATPIIINDHKYWRRKDRHLLTTGIYKNEIYKKIGKYPTNWESRQANWGKSEDWYDDQFKRNFPDGQIYRSHIPLMLSIWNDPRGGYAFIRGNSRYGHYLDPLDKDGLYYEKNVKDLSSDSVGPLSLVDIAHPIGWEISKDKNGEQLKYNQWKIMEDEGPEEKLP